MSEALSIAIIGGGLMGTGIAQVFTAAGHDVSLFDPDPDVRASLSTQLPSVAIVDTLDSAVINAAYVTEAAPERLDLKRSIFAELVERAPRSTILASNTSVIPIGRIAEGLDTADRIVGTHWWNPAPLIPLVEVVQAQRTSDETIKTTMALLRAIGKQPAHVRRDVPGFVANRLQHALWREAIAMVADGVCDAETLDHCVKASFGRRLAVLGPLENADLVGLDLTLDIHRTMMPELDRHAAPHPLLEAKVAAGKLGFKTYGGFRAWTDETIASTRKRLTDHLSDAASC